MGYVKRLLRGKLDMHRDALTEYKKDGELENSASCLSIISEIELALKLLDEAQVFKYN